MSANKNHSAKDVLAKLDPNLWRHIAGGDVALNAQHRLRLSVERNTDFKILAFDVSDPDNTDREMAKDFVDAIGDHLSPHNMYVLGMALFKEMARWQQEMPERAKIAEEFLAEASGALGVPTQNLDIPQGKSWGLRG